MQMSLPQQASPTLWTPLPLPASRMRVVTCSPQRMRLAPMPLQDPPADYPADFPADPRARWGVLAATARQAWVLRCPEG